MSRNLFFFLKSGCSVCRSKDRLSGFFAAVSGSQQDVHETFVGGCFGTQEPDPVCREDFLDVCGAHRGTAADAGGILCDDRLNETVFHIGHQLVEGRAVHGKAADTAVHIEAGVGKTVVAGSLKKQGFLILNDLGNIAVGYPTVKGCDFIH